MVSETKQNGPLKVHGRLTDTLPLCGKCIVVISIYKTAVADYLASIYINGDFTDEPFQVEVYLMTTRPYTVCNTV